MEVSETVIYKLACETNRLAQKAVPEYSSKFSKKTFTQHQHITILCVKARAKQKFYEMEQLLVNMPAIQQAIGLKQVPDHTTMCKALKRLSTKVLMVLLYMTASMLPPSGSSKKTTIRGSRTGP